MVQTLAELRAEEDDKNDNEKTDSGQGYGYLVFKI